MLCSGGRGSANEGVAEGESVPKTGCFPGECHCDGGTCGVVWVEGCGRLRGAVLGELEVERGRRELLGGRGLDDHVIGAKSEHLGIY